MGRGAAGARPATLKKEFMSIESTQQQAQEIATGKQFYFGANWARFLELLNDQRFAVAEESLRTMPHVKDLRPFASWRDYTKLRGMSLWRDVVDWVGGYLFEVAKLEKLVHFYSGLGFVLNALRTEGGDLGCNELVFVKKTGQSVGNPE